MRDLPTKTEEQLLAEYMERARNPARNAAEYCERAHDQLKELELHPAAPLDTNDLMAAFASKNADRKAQAWEQLASLNDAQLVSQAHACSSWLAWEKRDVPAEVILARWETMLGRKAAA